MRPTTKIKKEYSADDSNFPINGELAKLLIKSNGLKYDDIGRPAGVSRKTIVNWVNNRNVVPRGKALKAFKQLGITESNLDILVLKHPSEEVRQRLQHKLDMTRQAVKKLEAQKNKQSDAEFDKLADQVINLTQVVNQMSQNQKVFFTNWKQLFEQLSKYSDDQAKQQNYLVSEIKSLRKEVQQKNVLIRELQR